MVEDQPGMPSNSRPETVVDVEDQSETTLWEGAHPEMALGKDARPSHPETMIGEDARPAHPETLVVDLVTAAGTLSPEPSVKVSFIYMRGRFKELK